MTFEEAQALVRTLPKEQRKAVFFFVKHFADIAMVKGYELGFDHGVVGERADYETLFKLLDDPQ